jgi:hypothetical protein
MTTWLENLTKTDAPPTRTSAHPNPNVPTEFRDLFKVADDDEQDVRGAVTAKVYDSDPDTADLPTVVDTLFKAQERERFGLPTITANPPREKRVLAKGAPMQLFMRLSKIDEEQRLVYGIATSETPDRENEVLDYEGSKPLFRAWSESVQKDSQGASLGNVREMHNLSAVGTLAEIQFNDTAKQVEVCAKITDDNAWKKVLSRTYTGFSVGGKYAKTWQDGKLTRYVADPVEISLVDRPCVPDATFQLVKADGQVEICKFAIEKKGEAMKDAEHVKAIYEHLKSSHEDASAHHNERAAGHGAMLGQHKEGTPEHEFHKAAHESHLEARDAHDAKAEKCNKAIRDCEKAVGDDLNKTVALDQNAVNKMVGEAMTKFFNQIVPTNVSAIAPTVPARPGLTAVPRPGQQPTAAAPAVPLEFAKLFSTEDGDGESLRQ